MARIQADEIKLRTLYVVQFCTMEYETLNNIPSSLNNSPSSVGYLNIASWRCRSRNFGPLIMKYVELIRYYCTIQYCTHCKKMIYFILIGKSGDRQREH